jgi:hypothetical protein
MWDSHGKSKAITVQARKDPEGSRRLRLPDFMIIVTCKWNGYQPYSPAALSPLPQEIFLVLISVTG